MTSVILIFCFFQSINQETFQTAERARPPEETRLLLKELLHTSRKPPSRSCASGVIHQRARVRLGPLVSTESTDWAERRWERTPTCCSTFLLARNGCVGFTVWESPEEELDARRPATQHVKPRDRETQRGRWTASTFSFTNPEGLIRHCGLRGPFFCIRVSAVRSRAALGPAGEPGSIEQVYPITCWCPTWHTLHTDNYSCPSWHLKYRGKVNCALLWRSCNNVIKVLSLYCIIILFIKSKHN